MISLYSFLPLAAAGANVRERSLEANAIWVVVAIAAALLGVAGYLAFAHWSKGRANGHLALFHGLCQRHALGARPQKILRTIAQHYQVERPVQLFVEPTWLDKARAEKAFSEDSAVINELRERLFWEEGQAKDS